MPMEEISNLNAAQCILLAASLASHSDIAGLQLLVHRHRDVFDPELLFRILLTFLPEILDPLVYVAFIGEIGGVQESQQPEQVPVDVDSVKNLSEKEARQQVRKLHLLTLEYPLLPENAIQDPLSNFIIHRAHQVDAETGLLDLLPALVTPFIDRSDYLRTWYITTVLPLLRLDYEYYPQKDSKTSLETFEKLNGARGVHALLARAQQLPKQEMVLSSAVGRDLRGLVAPWVYGSSQRKRRRTYDGEDAIVIPPPLPELHFTPQSVAADKADIVRDWQHTFQWIFSTAMEDFELAASAIDQWDGPNDADFGGYAGTHELFSHDQDLLLDLRRQYCQTAFAIVYATDKDTPEIVEGAHSILVRLADLLGFEPPPELATSIHLLPRIDAHSSTLETFPKLLLDSEELLKAKHPLTSPRLDTYILLQMFVYSAYLLAGLENRVSIMHMAKLRFWSDAEDQLKLVQKILYGLFDGPKMNEDQRAHARGVLLWLWSWGISNNPDSDKNGYGIFGKVELQTLEKEILKTLLLCSSFSLAIKTYIKTSTPPLSQDDVEQVILTQFYSYYDNASNGNKTRGGIKRAYDLYAAFVPLYPTSHSLRRCKHLISATHALSFYSLTLQHGVPFQPVTIRVSEDPITLITKLLDQNPRSYTHLDDLTNIARDLTLARPPPHPTDLAPVDARIIAMAIEAALAEDDFETAYSYVMNRLPLPSSSAPDDLEPAPTYLAAYHAGLPPSTPTSTPPTTHRLSQRLELLSHALLLAPPAALPTILTAWQSAETDLLAALEHEHAAEAAFDDAADQSTAVPGGFVPDDIPVMGRRGVLGAGGTGTRDGETPLGLVDVFRGSWNAVNKTARGGGAAGGAAVRPVSIASSDGVAGGAGEEARARKRDMVANAVAGGLASGIGWVLGAQPVGRSSGEVQRE